VELDTYIYAIFMLVGGDVPSSEIGETYQDRTKHGHMSDFEQGICLKPLASSFNHVPVRVSQANS
jgi:hypothetical protein